MTKKVLVEFDDLPISDGQTHVVLRWRFPNLEKDFVGRILPSPAPAAQDNEREQESIEPLKYQLRQWRSLAAKYLPQTDCDRDDVAAIEKLIQRAAQPAERDGAVPDGRTIAKARDAWFDSVEGAQCASGYTMPDKSNPAFDKYLRNRLETAFIAGASTFAASHGGDKQ